MKTKLFTIILMLFCVVNFAFAEIKSTGLSDNGLKIHFTPESINWKSVETANGAKALYPISEDASPIEKVGSPAVLQNVITVGIPISAKPTVNIINSEIDEEKEIELAPYPKVMEKNGFQEFIYEKDQKAYQNKDFYPANPIVEYSTSYIRNQRVLQIKVAPFQYNSSTNLIRIYKKLEIEISFNSQRGNNGEFQVDEKFESLYKNLLPNYEQAKNWRLPSSVQSQRTVDPFASSTDWLKIYVKNPGTYKISYADLSNAGVNVDAIDPQTFRIYNAGGKSLSKNSEDPRPDFRQVAIKVIGESDGSFDSNDYILFWGIGTFGWEFEGNDYQYYDNRYTDSTNVYWLTYGGTEAPLRMETLNSPNQPSPYIVDGFPRFAHVEKNRDYFPRASYTNNWDFWIWETLQGQGEENVYYDFDVAHADLTKEIKIYSPIIGYTPSGTSAIKHRTEFFCNDVFVGNLGYENTWLGNSIRSLEATVPAQNLLVPNGTNFFRIRIPREEGYKNDIQKFNFFEVKYWHLLKAYEDKLHIQMPTIPYEYLQYNITNFTNSNINVFDVTDKFAPKQIIPLTASSDLVKFQAEYTQREFYLTTISEYKTPDKIEKEEVAYLRSDNTDADMIIITHPDFYPDINALAAHHNSKGLTTKIVKITDIMNEFAFGLNDPTAIRDYLQFIWDNSFIKPSYVLLVGDGHYDYRGFSELSKTNYIPPHYYSYSTDEYPTDDWFCYLNIDGTTDNLMDLACGRFPVSSHLELEIVMDKIIRYEATPEFGIWKNSYIFVADDEYERKDLDPISNFRHVRDTESLIETDGVVPKKLIKKKIYLTEYPKDAAHYKPQAADALVSAWNEGALGVNYIGHGNSEVWAHEWVLQIGQDIARMTNGYKLPIVLAASCDVGRFDNILGHTSLGEKLLIVPGKGCISSICSARKAQPPGNYNMNKKFFDKLFDGEEIVGTALMYAKINVPGANSRKYIHFGDPSLNLAYPKRSVKVTPIQNLIQKGQILQIFGSVQKENSQEIDSDFNGLATLVVQDNLREKRYVSPDISPPSNYVDYILPGKNIFKGLIEIENGVFNSEFIIPLKTTEGNRGRLTAYIWNEELDGAGYYDSLQIFGTTAVYDSVGPVMALYNEGKLVKPGGKVPYNATLSLVIEDPNGIDIRGVSGKQIMVEIIDDKNTQIDLTSNFIYDLGSYTKGSAEISLRGLEPGEHTLRFRSFDNFDNISTYLDANGDGKIDQQDKDAAGTKGEYTIIIAEPPDPNDWTLEERVTNYPNPFDEDTEFVFDIQKGGNVKEEIKITIKIYTVAGRLIKTIENAKSPHYWNGRDEEGDQLANGTYLYKLIAEGDDKTEEYFGKLSIMR